VDFRAVRDARRPARPRPPRALRAGAVGSRAAGGAEVRLSHCDI